MSSKPSNKGQSLFFLAGKDDSWESFVKRFKEHAVDGQLPKDKFGECIGMEQKQCKEFAEELFDALAKCREISAKNGITVDELKMFWEDMTNEDIDTRLRIFFAMCDKNGDGQLSEEEIKKVIVLSAKVNKLPYLVKQAREYAALIMEGLDTEKNGYIKICQLRDLLKEMVSDQVERAKSLKQTEKPLLRIYLHKAKDFLLEKWMRIWIITLWVSINLALFLWKFFQYKNKGAYQIMGPCLCIAKGAAETLKFNMALILIPMCRKTLTKLRSTFLSKLVPFDDNIEFHKIIAASVVTGTLVHVVMHISCDFVKLVSCPSDKFMRILGSSFDNNQPSYLDLLRSPVGLTGIVMIALMAFVFTLALQKLRTPGVKFPSPIFHHFLGFNSFWYTHHLLIFVYVLLVIHGYFLLLIHDWTKKTTWMYIVVPILIYTIERASSHFNEGVKPVVVDKAVVYSGSVLALALHMSKPQGFDYKSGMYIFIKCPEISPFEWHPFSLTSARDDEYLSVHIKGLGDWTKELTKRFKEVCPPENEQVMKKGSLVRTETRKHSDFEKKQAGYPTILIKGPFGAPSQDFQKYDILLLIGLGIGATPFISIMKDKLNTMKAKDDVECGSSGSSSSTEQKCLKRAYFYWVTPDQESLEWFKGVMDDIAEYDHDNVIEVHNHLSSVHEDGDARCVFIGMIQKLRHDKDGHDALSESRIKTHFGRPDWSQMFAQLASNHPGSKIGVFYCGNTKVMKTLKQLCQKFNSNPDTTTRFEFHKENF